jgi:X-linked retinitis pigmentosa GTPase regulator
VKATAGEEEDEEEEEEKKDEVEEGEEEEEDTDADAATTSDSFSIIVEINEGDTGGTEDTKEVEEKAKAEECFATERFERMLSIRAAKASPFSRSKEIRKEEEGYVDEYTYSTDEEDVGSDEEEKEEEEDAGSDEEGEERVICNIRSSAGKALLLSTSLFEPHKQKKKTMKE